MERYSTLLKAARQLYLDRYFHSATGCFGNSTTGCTDISQILGLTLDLLTPEQETLAWTRALEWFGVNGKYEGRFGGGIVSLKLLYPLLVSAQSINSLHNQCPGMPLRDCVCMLRTSSI